MAAPGVTEEGTFVRCEEGEGGVALGMCHDNGIVGCLPQRKTLMVKKGPSCGLLDCGSVMFKGGRGG